jgi:hypothetical protein
LLAELAAADPVSFEEFRLRELLEPAKEAVDWSAALGLLPSGDGAGSQHMTFIVSEAQKSVIERALAAVQEIAAGDDGAAENKNRRGCALAALAAAYLG